jgi:alkanesulfonate monooxygenase SsuD/methylene tetrahydromethanopterin reductase-like flavin-dependent oxidoreductase (luciferase family)
MWDREHVIDSAARRIGLAVPEPMLEEALVEGRAAQLFADLEADGVDSLWILDQLSGRARTSEPFGLLGFAAALTTRVRLGIAILVGASRGPLVAAKSLTTLDRLSRGRLTVGLGLGGRAHYASYGVGDLPPGKLLDEFIVGLNRLWCEREDQPPADDASGLHWDVSNSSISPLPVQKPHPPIWIGGASDATYRRAIRTGTGWVGGGKQPFGEFCESVKRLQDLEPGSDFTISKRVYLLVQPDRARADAQLREWFGTFYNVPELGTRVAVVGDVGECADRLRAHYDAGADHLIVHPILGSRDQYDAVIGDVVPVLASDA